ncbi:MAG: protein kinase [Myxococcaceae bacterium]
MGKQSDELTTTVPSGSHRDPLAPEDSAKLPHVTVAASPAPDVDFELGETIGVGGMGRVVSARQTALDRPVATKFLKDPEGDAKGLLREALVTGRLEHPNIVPVHLLATTADGVPFFAMKKVEGTPWTQVIAEKRPLIEQLEILVRVCDAVAFAHDRQVLHRDIKPDNVLVGAFGEVYLVDWGLAVSLRPDLVLPLATEADFAGTPAYMAPEMARGDGRGIDVRSDVYLLGATLYELLTGRLPHRATTPSGVLAVALEGRPPEFDQPVPRELAAICRKAMQKEPSARHQTALEFKQAITEYLRHREAFELSELAQRRLAELEQAVSQERGVGSSVMGLQAHQIFAECRFAFEQLARMWPALESARQGLRKAMLLMVEHELSRDEPRAARILLAQVTAAPEALVARVEAAEDRQIKREARLYELERDAKDRDIDLALAEKRQFSLIFGVLAFIGGMSTQVATELKLLVPTTKLGVVVFGLPLLTSELFSFVVRRTRQQNLAQRRLMLGLKVSAWSSVAMWITAWMFDVSVTAAMTMYFVQVASNWLISAALWQRRAARVGVAIALAALGALAFPRFVFAFGGLASGIGFALMGLSLRNRTEEAAPV